MHLSWPYHPSCGALIDVPATNEGRYELAVSFAKTWAEPFRSFLLNNVRPDTPIKRLDVLDWAPPIGLRSKGQAVLMGDAFHLMSMCKCSSFSRNWRFLMSLLFSFRLRSNLFPLQLRDAAALLYTYNTSFRLLTHCYFILDRGEGANHAIVDVLDFATHVVPMLAPCSLQHTHQGAAQAQDPAQALRQALDGYEDAVVSRSRPGVLASRRACLDAHAFSRLFGEGAATGGISPLLSKREMALQFDDESMELMGQ